MATETTRPIAPKKKAGARPRVASASRWLHIYLSMVSFVVVLFFAITGLTLNHADWFDEEGVTVDTKGKMNLSWTNPSDTAKINKLAIVEFLRTTHHLQGAVSDFRIDNQQVSVSFRGPGYTADSFIERSNGAYQLTETRLGLVAVMNDLHKGRDTGRSWSLVIDIAAIFMTLVSLTGLILLFFLKKRRVSGLILAGIGGLICYLIYVVWVA